VARGAVLAILGIALLLTIAAAAPAAFANVRYAEPSGTGAANVCAQADPCSIDDAVEDASVNNGDEVVVLPGTYDLGTGTVTVDNSIDLHGADGGPRPKITTASSTAFNGAVSVTAGGATVRDLELENTDSSPNAVAYYTNTGTSTTAERLIVTSNSSGPTCEVIRGTLRDSLCLNTGSGFGFGVIVGGAPGDSITTNLRNVTAVARGSAAFSDGIVLSTAFGLSYTISAKNVIAHGGTGLGYDVRADQSGGGTGTVNLEYSNFDSEDPSGTGSVTNPGTGIGDQTAAPVFVNPAAGNYHQKQSSPTVDTGNLVADLFGSADFDGGPRVTDGKCDGTLEADIGADELAVAGDHDFFASAEQLTGSTATASGANVCGTEEAGEPFYDTEDVDSSNPTVTRSVWYSWTSPGDGPATVDLCTGNDYDTMLAVFTGGDLASLNLVAANNNSPDCPAGSFASKVSFTATEGTTYWILVDGCCGLPAGNFTLNVNGPAASPPPGGGGGGGGADTNPPETTITNGPPPKTKQKTATFGFGSGEANSTFECKLDTGPFEACVSLKTYTKVKKGVHTFQVRAIDQAGNADPTPASASWKVKKKRKKKR